VIEIRSATREDVPLLQELVCALAAYERLSNECIATEEKLAATLFGARRVAEALIADLDGTPAGFALFFPNYSTFLAHPGLYLEDLFVKPELRGRGVGRALFHRVAQIAVENGCGRFEWAALNWNEPALGFYKHMGAAAISDWTVYRLTGEDLRKAAEGTSK
jgi:GNAT superfamily N-acetyltransferase